VIQLIPYQSTSSIDDQSYLVPLLSIQWLEFLMRIHFEELGE